MKNCFYLIFAFCMLPALAMEQPPVIAMTDEETLTIEKADIFTACANGDLKRVQELIKSGVSVESVCPYELEQFKNFSVPGLKGCTPLMIAAAAGHATIVSFLIGAGANIHCRSKSEQGFFDAFCFAVLYNRIRAAQALLHAGARLDTVVHKSFWGKVFGDGPRIFNIAIALNQLPICFFMEASGSRVDVLSLAVAAKKSEDCLKGIISHSFVLPPFDQYRQSASKVKTLLMYFKRMALPRDLRHLLILRAVPEDIIPLLSRYYSLKKRIPSNAFALDLMTNACYCATAEQLVPELERVHSKRVQHGIKHSIAPLLDPTNFEANYGEQLRANIRARLANPYQYMNQLLALEDKKDGENKK